MKFYAKANNSDRDKYLKSIVTIVLPTHRRHDLLDRALKYYNDFGIRILVGDSTETIFPDANKYHCEYYHLPDMKFYEKIEWLVNKVDTEFMLLCSDDDFTIKNSILRCVAFLESHKDYTAAQGETIFFQSDNGIISIRSDPQWIYNKTDYNQSDVYNRVCENFRDTLMCLYAVRRTNTVKNILGLPRSYNISNTILCEFTHYFCEYVKGYIKVLPILFRCRSVEPRQECNDNLNLYDAFNSKEIENYKQLIADQLLQYYSPTLLAEKGGVDAIVNLMSNWLSIATTKNKKVLRLCNRINYGNVISLQEIPYFSARKLGLTLKKDARKEWAILKRFLQQYNNSTLELQSRQLYFAMFRLPDYAANIFLIWYTALRSLWIAFSLTINNKIAIVKSKTVQQYNSQTLQAEPIYWELTKLPDFALDDRDRWLRAFRNVWVAIRRSFGFQDYFKNRLLNNTILFNQGCLQLKKTSGIGSLEHWGCWSTASKVSLTFYYPFPKIFVLRLRATVFGPNANETFTARIGSCATKFHLKTGINELFIPYVIHGNKKTLTIEIPEPTSPLSLGLGSDHRLIGIGLYELEICAPGYFKTVAPS